MKRILSVAVISAAGGILAHVGIFYFINIEAPEAQPRPVDSAQFDYLGDLGASSDPVLRQQSQLFDSSPLFMPTRWNLVSEMSDVASLREATEVFSLFVPQLSLPESPAAPEFTAINADFDTKDALPDGPAFLLSRFGRQATELAEVSQSTATISAYRLDSANIQSKKGQVLPESLVDVSPDSLWVPVQFYLQIVEGKPLGVPAVAQSSGFSAWDQALQKYIGSLDFYRTLNNGYFRVIVYP